MLLSLYLVVTKDILHNKQTCLWSWKRNPLLLDLICTRCACFVLFFPSIRKQTSGRSLVTIPQKVALVIFPMLLSDAKCDVLCFAIGTFACTARGQSLQNLIEKICFLHFSITSYLTQEPISHTVCQSKDAEKKEKQQRQEQKRDAFYWHRIRDSALRSVCSWHSWDNQSERQGLWLKCIPNMCPLFKTAWWRLTGFPKWLFVLMFKTRKGSKAEV